MTATGRVTKIVSSALITLTLPLASSHAQGGGSSPLRFGLTAGATVPVSDYSSDKHIGYNLAFVVDVRTPTPLLGFRIDGAYNELGYNGNTTREQIWTANANLLVKVPTGTMVTPYLIGGTGIYNSHRNVFLKTGQSTDLGVNAGGGVRLALTDVTAFVEARYHKVSDPNQIRIVPINFGFVF